MAELIRFRIMLLPFEPAKSIAASWVSTVARSLITWFMIVELTVIGALTLGYLEKVLSLNAYSSELRLMLTGVILVLAVLFQRRFARESA